MLGLPEKKEEIVGKKKKVVKVAKKYVDNFLAKDSESDENDMGKTWEDVMIEH